MERVSRLSVRRHLTAALSLATAVAAVAVVGGQASPLSDAQLFDDIALQRIDLQVSQRDWDTLRERFESNTYYPAAFSWRGQAAQNVGIRSRGSGTRSGVKPGLLVDFDRYVSGQRFLGLKALVLDNHLQDPSAMREALTMTILAKLGLPAPREAHAELYINGEFFGVYAVVENIDSVATARLFAPPASSSPLEAVTGKARIRNTPPVLKTPAPTVAQSIPTGYLFEYNWLDYYYETYLGFDLDPYVALFDPETRDSEPRETLYRPIEAMFREISQAPDGEFLQRVSPHLDLSLYVQLVAVEAFMADWDGVAGDFGANNFYLYRPADGGPHRLIAWDTDSTFHALDFQVDGAQANHLLVRRAMQVPELRRLYLETLEKVALLVEARGRGQNTGWLENEVVRRHALMSARHAQDRVRPHSADEVANAVAFNIEFARQRPGIVRQQIQSARQQR
jgi:hypothetical protein